MKKFLLLVLVLFLCACSSSESDIEQAVAATIAAQNLQESSSTSTSNPTSTVRVVESATTQPTAQMRPTNTPSPTVPPPTATPIGSSLKLIPYNYTLEDEGNGWTKGSIEIAIENNSSQPYFEQDNQKPIPSPSDNYFISLGEATLQTIEGQPYPIEINGGTTPPRLSLPLHGYIPGGFRLKVEQMGGSRINPWTITWRAATTTTPEKITFSDAPELSFDLPAVGESAPNFPYDIPPSDHEFSLSELSGVQYSPPDYDMLLTFTGRCVNVNSGGSDINTFIEVEISNQDQFNGINFLNASGSYLFRHTYFIVETTSGRYRQPEFDMIKTATEGLGALHELGPGQTVTAFWELGHIFDSQGMFELGETAEYLFIPYFAGPAFHLSSSDCDTQ